MSRRCELCGGVVQVDEPLHDSCRGVIRSDRSEATYRQMAKALTQLTRRTVTVKWVLSHDRDEVLAQWRWLFGELQELPVSLALLGVNESR